MTADGAEPPTLSSRALTLLAYLGGWATGAVVWLLDLNNPRLRFHAIQSVVLFGGLTFLWIALWLGSFAALTAGSGYFTVLQRLSQGVLVVMVGLWLFALWQAWTGRDWQAPLAGRLAARAATSRRSSPPARS